MRRKGEDMRGKPRTAAATPQRLSNEEFFTQQSLPLHLYHQYIHEPIDVHWHEFYEVHFILAGAGRHVLNGQEHQLQVGSLFLLTPTDFHALLPQPGQSLELFNVIFQEEVFAPEFFTFLFATSGNLITQASSEVAQELEYEFRRLWRECEQRQIGYQEVMRGALARILIGLRRECSPPHAIVAPSEEHPLRVTLQPALIYLQHHFRESLSLADVAGQVGLSPHYFSECFHKATGLTFQAYVQDLRLRFAHALLAVSHMPITTICSSSGFTSLAHFERVFKRRFGITPRTHQQQCAKEK